MAGKHALCVGINQYLDPADNLGGCVNDAMDWRDVLTARGFACRTLLDQDATRANILEGMRRLAAEAAPDDVVVVAYAGHGSVAVDIDGDEKDGLDESWCPHDVAVSGPILDDDIEAVYRTRRDGVRWLIISDSCNSGSVSRRTPLDDLDDRDASAQRSGRFLAPTVFDARAADRLAAVGHLTYRASPPGRRGPLLLAGCKDDQVSEEAVFEGRRNGAFTYAAIRALGEISVDATYSDWLRAIRRYLPSGRFDQEPQLYDVSNQRGAWRVFAAKDDPAGASIAPTTGSSTTGLADDVATATGRAMAAAAAASVARTRVQARSTRTHLIAEGDSWFNLPLKRDVREALVRRYGYKIEHVANHGDTAENIAFNQAQRDQFAETLSDMVDRGQPPKAVLLSAGGNDIAGETFSLVLNPKASGSPGLNDVIVRELVENRVRSAYVTLFTAINELSAAFVGRRLPILIHGYDYPVPDGRGYRLGVRFAGPWLDPGFELQGYSKDSSAEMRERREILMSLLDQFNGMLESLAAGGAYGDIRYVNLRDALDGGADHKDDWRDEMHATNNGCEKLAARFHAAIQNAIGGGR